MADLELDGPNSAISVDTLKPKTATTLTLGENGDTIALGSGATSTGFGATYNGAVNWQSAIKTSDFTAVSGEGYFVDTSSAVITATLPASPSAGDIASFKDYAESFETNNLTIARNGSLIAGGTEDALISTNRASITMIYVDATKGWLFTMESNIGDLLPAYVAATGGTITTSGDYKIHTFTSSGTFTVTNAGGASGSNTVDYMVVAGGGGGGADVNRVGGGGGAGGFRESVPSPAAWTASPLANPGGSLPVSAQAYPITVGGGAAKEPGNGGSGSNSVFSTITSAGGGGGGSSTIAAITGGSGGGGSADTPGVSGNTPSVSPPQGSNGGNGINPGSASTQFGAGGGGGATAGGGSAPTSTGPTHNAGDGGAGATTSISASPTAYAGGGGGGAEPQGFDYRSGTGGIGGGGDGAQSPNASPSVGGSSGTANTGGGGGGSAGGPSPGEDGGAGGSGIVVIRYKFQ